MAEKRFSEIPERGTLVHPKLTVREVGESHDPSHCNTSDCKKRIVSTFAHDLLEVWCNQGVEHLSLTSSWGSQL